MDKKFIDYKSVLRSFNHEFCNYMFWVMYLQKKFQSHLPHILIWLNFIIVFQILILHPYRLWLLHPKGLPSAIGVSLVSSLERMFRILCLIVLSGKEFRIRGDLGYCFPKLVLAVQATWLLLKKMFKISRLWHEARIECIWFWMGM